MKKTLLVRIDPDPENIVCVTWFVSELTKCKNIYALPRKKVDILNKKRFNPNQYFKLLLSKILIF